MCVNIELCEVFDFAEKINVYLDGEKLVFCSGEEEFDKILAGWKDMVFEAHDLPAFGVSLNGETVKAVKKGTWVEFVFDKLYESNGMPYSKLLINTENGISGFNLIRYNSETGYDGRCFYYDLVKRNTNDFYEILVNLRH